ncbi:late competence development ComFB family protein [Gilvimarinus sp. DA14]|uniref:late competence development ComFB family protein n=1 Tax=Gilvimarinus sp. DA14 TaxID=2956798 RepID=UPI0020B7498C|nr:late competence development ComFB family protein [Gilvimarinus sp. DA14]UTF61408.1 late competence development ComFB family protein [Gilvimarinus sp. DA14]
MLATTARPNPNRREDVDNIHNYYERHVIEAILEASERARQGDRDFLADVACVALNHLPPKYIRHDVDMSFFMSPQELEEVNDKIARAVNHAISYVSERETENSAKDSETEPTNT